MPHRITAKLYKKNQYKNLTLNNMQEKILQEIGLTNSEIIVYTALLKSGSKKVGELMKRTNLHRSSEKCDARCAQCVARPCRSPCSFHG